MSPTAGTMPGKRRTEMTQPRSCRFRRLVAAVPLTVLLVGASSAARAQSSTLPPTDIANQQAQPAGTASAPTPAAAPAPVPAPVPETPPPARLMVPAPIISLPPPATVV